MPTTIEEWVLKHKLSRLAGHPNCWTCNIPEASDLNDAYQGGVGVALLCAYLAEEAGYDPSIATEGRLRGHFRRGHHLEGTT